MHELAIMQSVVRVCEREAAKEGFGRVESITLAVGAVSGVVPECLLEFFPDAATGTVAEGARLVTRLIPAAIECPDCGYAGAYAGGVPALRRLRLQAHARAGVLYRFVGS